MRVPDRLIKCVAFLAYWNGEQYTFVGTAFFVGTIMEHSEEERTFFYLVTARHVIERIESVSADGFVYMRLNSKDSGAIWARSDVDQWYSHPNDSSVDVAVLSFPLANSQFDHLFWSTKSFVSDEVAEKEGIGIGEEVFVMGLFGRHSGSERNRPIIRIGNIAAMSEEPVSTKLGAMEAHLIEVRSIGGISGSPVVVNLSVVRNIKGSPALKLQSGGSFFLLGLIHGHWNQLASQVDGISVDRDYGESPELLNMGIAIVVPAPKIVEVINHPALLEIREEEMTRIRARSLQEIDTTIQTKGGGEP